MTSRAIARIQALAERLRLLVLPQLVEIHGGELFIDRVIVFRGGLHLGFILALLRPTEHAFIAAKTGECDQVTNSPCDRDEIQVEPPLWSGVVPLLEVAVPFMANDFVVGDVCRSLLG